MTPPAPRVSVLVPVYNALPWLPIAVESVLAQTLTDFELLLVDDGSTDGSGEACDGYAARDGRVRVLRHDGGANRGQVASMNLGLAEARSAYVARLDADDIAYPTRLAKQVAHLDAHPEVALVGSQVDWAAPWGTSRWTTPTEPHQARWTLSVENCFMHGGVTYRTAAVRALGGYDAAFAPAEDYDLWLRLAEQHDVVNLPETLAWFNNLRTDNLSTTQFERQEASVLRLSARGIRRYLPDASDEAIRDLYYVGRGWEWADAPSGGERVRRLTEAAAMLVRLHRSFLLSAAVPARAQSAIRADRDRRLMRIRLALAASGGVGHLARLFLPRWDRSARLLQLPALLSPRRTGPVSAW